MFRLVKHRTLLAHHRYQLEVVFLFVAGLLLFLAYTTLLTYYGKDTDRAQWYFFWPWMAIFGGYSLYTRNTIPAREAIDPLYRPIGHWVLLGLTLLAAHLNPPGEQFMYPSIDYAFAIFSLFLADAYWDFKK